MANRIHSFVIGVLAFLVTLITAGVLVYGRAFYLTGYADRPHHDLFRVLRSAGLVGHGLGILGSAMVLLLLVYSLRKRTKIMQRWGNLRIWLRYHIFLGIAGPVLITLHTSFKVQGLVAVSYWSMVAVALSGFFGRYLYQQIPRNVLGEALSEEAIENRREELLVTLADDHGLQGSGVDALEDLAMARLSRVPLAMGLLILPFLNIVLARRLQNWERDFVVSEDKGARNQGREWV
ncbi:hypothetical protein COW53_09715, partial [bacterium CG17_big_fil_post_rev_8_21_14_2_50_64_8]